MVNYFDHYGKPVFSLKQMREMASMGSPVRCNHCGGLYDLQAVTVTARYADCSVWDTPCCHRQVDTRVRWSGDKHYEKL